MVGRRAHETLHQSLKRRWIIGLAAFSLIVTGVTVLPTLGGVQKGTYKPGEPIPGASLLNQPWVELLQDNVTLKPGETKEIYCILKTRYYPASENWIEIYTGLNERPPWPEGIRIYAPHLKVEPYENALVRITIETDPELEAGVYVFYVGNNYSPKYPAKLTLRVARAE